MNFKAEKPDGINFTLTVTLTLGEWKKVKEALGKISSGEDIYDSIQEMINKAEKEFYPPLK